MALFHHNLIFWLYQLVLKNESLYGLENLSDFLHFEKKVVFPSAIVYHEGTITPASLFSTF